MFFQALARAHQRAGCAQPGDKVRYRAIGLPPYLRACAVIVRPPVGVVVVLVGIEVTLRLLRDEFPRGQDCAVTAF